MIDYIVVGLVSASLLFIVLNSIKRRKSGQTAGCGGCCGNCSSTSCHVTVGNKVDE